ncbi:hypothetical protein PRIPAC_76003 [Pristionchus pacificus]|uniref:Uncharacterized protein n=1 Tax=Pristionchus pacificus TaxID=54126 RepID=A0A2A6B4P1_PRIPA|nr:hypothetical protein PRIPAC_76003 [Pristionchus pacificus]|eukprot:PDM60842.1 hypothetical protein PRIPAC_54648 [Pristionchus pacificus]
MEVNPDGLINDWGKSVKDEKQEESGQGKVPPKQCPFFSSPLSLLLFSTLMIALLCGKKKGVVAKGKAPSTLSCSSGASSAAGGKKKGAFAKGGKGSRPNSFSHR